MDRMKLNYMSPCGLRVRSRTRVSEPYGWDLAGSFPLHCLRIYTERKRTEDDRRRLVCSLTKKDTHSHYDHTCSTRCLTDFRRLRNSARNAQDIVEKGNSEQSQGRGDVKLRNRALLEEQYAGRSVRREQRKSTVAISPVWRAVPIPFSPRSVSQSFSGYTKLRGTPRGLSWCSWVQHRRQTTVLTHNVLAVYAARSRLR